MTTRNVPSHHSPAPAVRIGTPTMETRGEWVRVTYPVSGLDADALWFEVDAEFASFVDDSGDAAVMALFPLAMQQGSDLHVDGHLSERLAWHLHHTVFRVTRVQRPEFHDIRVVAAAFTPETAPRGRAVITGLSCGVDSFSVVADHLLDPTVRVEDRLTHFLFNHLGSHGERKEEADLRAEIRWRGVDEAARELGLPVIRVRSNQQDFYGYSPRIRLRFPEVISSRNAAVPLFLQRGVRRWLFASAVGWPHIIVRPTKDQPEADPILLPAFSTERVECVSTGVHRSRVEKTQQIASLDIVRRRLDVCFRPGDGSDNCSNCSKCVRTLLTLDLLGQLDDFRATFNVDLFRRNRRRHLVDTLVRREAAFQEEILGLMQQVGFRLPMDVRLQAAWIRFYRRRFPDAVQRRVKRLSRKLNRALGRPRPT